MCPHDQFGKTQCQIILHPDNPHESFCATCNKRFLNQNQGIAGFHTPFFVTVFAAVFSVLLYGYIVDAPTSTTNPSAPVQQVQ